jgi:hypothetical protein
MLALRPVPIGNPSVDSAFELDETSVDTGGAVARLGHPNWRNQ